MLEYMRTGKGTSENSQNDFSSLQRHLNGETEAEGATCLTICTDKRAMEQFQ